MGPSGGVTKADLDKQAKGSRETCLVAWQVREPTLAWLSWVAQRLMIGAASRVGACAKRIREATDSEVRRLRYVLEMSR